MLAELELIAVSSGGSRMHGRAIGRKAGGQYSFSHSEREFFGSPKVFRKEYLKGLRAKAL